MKSFFPCLLTFACAISLLMPVASTRAQTQAEFERGDAELNRTYKALLAKLPDAESKQKLKETQRAWLASRDTEVARAANEARGGSTALTRYETMARLTRGRIKELNNIADHGTQSGPKLAASIATTLPSSTPESTGKQARSVSETPGPAAAPSANSLSPDRQWEYTGGEIVKAGTTQVVLDLDQELEVYGPELSEILWAPDSKRFGFNYSPLHAHHTTYEAVAFYQLRDNKWVALHSPVDKASERAQLAQLAKDYLPKSFNPRHCAPEWDELKLRKWTDANTAILYAPCYGGSRELKAAFLFTLKFDDAGKWKIVKTHQMSKKEIEAESD